MKKLLSLAIILLALGAVLAACSPSENEPPVVLTEYFSDNGYKLSYPEELTPSSFSREIDFVVLDNITGTTVTVQTADKKEGVLSIGEDDFSEMVKAEGLGEIEISAFEQREQNGMPALVVMYTYNENELTRVIYESDDKLYYATYTELPGTGDRVRSRFIPIIYSLAENSAE